MTAARELYVERWGTPGRYLFNCSDSFPGESIDAFRETLLASARQGDRITVTAAGRSGRLLVENGLTTDHENIAFLALPRFFPGRVMRRVVEQIASDDAGAMLITEDVAKPLPLSRLSFADFSARLTLRRDRYYQGDVHV